MADAAIERGQLFLDELALVRGQAADAVRTEDAQWPEPLPLVARYEPKAYPHDALPPGIGAAVHEAVDFVQCPFALAASAALATVSAAIQGLVDVRRAENLAGPCSLYLLTILESGERKTTAERLFSVPIHEWEKRHAEEAASTLQRFAADFGSWEARRDGIKAAIRKAAERGKPTEALEHELRHIEQDKPNQPRLPRLLHLDSTPEALSWNLAHGWPSGAVFASEAGLVFGGHAMGRDTQMRNLALHNVLWDGAPLHIDRRGTGSFAVRGARLTMGLAVQPGTLHAFLESSNGLARGIGFVSRFLLASPMSTQGERLYKDPPAAWPRLHAHNRRISALLDMPHITDEHGHLCPLALDLSPEAKTVWIRFHDDVERELRDGGDMTEARDVASKAGDNAARLAALFHVYEEGPHGTISGENTERAGRIVGWHLYEARRVLGELAVSQSDRDAARLDEWLINYCRTCGGATVPHREVLHRGPNPTRKSASLAPALRMLHEANRVRVRTCDRQKFIDVNPRLLERS